MLISETVRERAKRTKIWDHQRKKTYLTENFNFWSCDLVKSVDSAFFVQKGLILETVRARAKQAKFWDHQLKLVLRFWRKESYLGNGKS